VLLRRITTRRVKQVFFTDEKNFYLNPPVSNQNNRVWSDGVKDIEPRRLLVEREKFARHVMVSAGVCFGGKSRLHFVEEKSKVNAAYYVGSLLPMLVDDCKRLLRISARRRSCSHGPSDAGLVDGKLYRIYRKGPMATKFTRPQPT
jgi:hypothetical protein